MFYGNLCNQRDLLKTGHLMGSNLSSAIEVEY